MKTLCNIKMWILTELLLVLLLTGLPSAVCGVCIKEVVAPGSVVSTTTSGCTMISCEEYCVGSSVMVVREMSDGMRAGMRGWTRRLLLLWWNGRRCTRGEGSGDGTGMWSESSGAMTWRLQNKDYDSTSLLSVNCRHSWPTLQWCKYTINVPKVGVWHKTEPEPVVKLTSAAGPISDSSTGRKTKPLSTPSRIKTDSTTKKYLQRYPMKTSYNDEVINSAPSYNLL